MMVLIHILSVITTCTTVPFFFVHSTDTLLVVPAGSSRLGYALRGGLRSEYPDRTHIHNIYLLSWRY